VGVRAASTPLACLERRFDAFRLVGQELSASALAIFQQLRIVHDCYEINERKPCSRCVTRFSSYFIESRSWSKTSSVLVRRMRPWEGYSISSVA
jgi:hypothetical protein